LEPENARHATRRLLAVAAAFGVRNYYATIGGGVFVLKTPDMVSYCVNHAETHDENPSPRRSKICAIQHALRKRLKEICLIHFAERGQSPLDKDFRPSAEPIWGNCYRNTTIYCGYISTR
jgi:hypothetical protein